MTPNRVERDQLQLVGWALPTVRKIGGQCLSYGKKSNA